MKTIPLGKSGLQVPAIAVGCMRLTSLDVPGAQRFIGTAIDNGANFFDHADIYGGGQCESLFGKAYPLTPANREKVILQSKCGIRPGVAFDFSKEHILRSVDGILSRLGTDYLDVLLLHRPDALMEPEEVADAFDSLYASGKVRHFGVSNQNPMQMQLMQKYLHQPLVANQLQMSLTNATMVSQGLHVNMLDDFAVCRDGSVLDFCRLNDITIQPWSPFQYGFFEGVFIGSEKFPALNQKLEELAEKYSVTPTAIALAWLLRHPAKMQPVCGTMNLDRLQQCIRATEITLTRDEWYALFMAAGNTLP